MPKWPSLNHKGCSSSCSTNLIYTSLSYFLLLSFFYNMSFSVYHLIFHTSSFFFRITQITQPYLGSYHIVYQHSSLNSFLFFTLSLLTFKFQNLFHISSWQTSKFQNLFGISSWKTSKFQNLFSISSWPKTLFFGNSFFLTPLSHRLNLSPQFYLSSKFFHLIGPIFFLTFTFGL